MWSQIERRLLTRIRHRRQVPTHSTSALGVVLSTGRSLFWRRRRRASPPATYWAQPGDWASKLWISLKSNATSRNIWTRQERIAKKQQPRLKQSSSGSLHFSWANCQQIKKVKITSRTVHFRAMAILRGLIIA